MLEIKGLKKSYWNTTGKKEALRDVNLTLSQGEIVGLFGENGAGKTTLMKCILNLVHYDGSIVLDGERIGKDNIHRLSFATCEHSFFPNLNGVAHRDFYKHHFPHFREKRFRGLMEFFELPMNKPIKSFSTGQQNQFEVIMALCQGADYVIMDEPFAGNDVFNREDFYRLLLGILEPQETILLSTHLIEEVSSFISRAILLHQGEILGDQDIMELEDQGKNLMDYVKGAYCYREDRVSKSLEHLTEE